MIYALCRKIDFVENLRVFGVKLLTEISIRVKNLTFSMSASNSGILLREAVKRLTTRVDPPPRPN